MIVIARFKFLAQSRGKSNRTIQVKLSDTEHQDRDNQADLPACPCIGQWFFGDFVDKELDWNQVLYFRRTRGGHRKSNRSKCDRCGDKPSRQIGQPKQVNCQGINGKANDKQRDTAVSQQRTRQHYSQAGSLCSQRLSHAIGHGDCGTRLFHELAKYGSEREEEIEPANIVRKPIHVRAVQPCHWIFTAEDCCNQCTQGANDENALAADNKSHQQGQRSKQDQHEINIKHHD